LGLTAGPVPPRVDTCVQAGLLDRVEHAVERGWSTRRAAGLLGLDEMRVQRWWLRRVGGQLADRPPGGHPRQGLLDWERTAIVELFEAWAETDRSHRKLAHRGSRLDLVHVSESTVARVLAAEGLIVPGPQRREPRPRTPWPDWLEWTPHRVWADDFTHVSRARRAAIAIPGCGLPPVDHHPGLCRGDLHPGRGGLHRRAGRRGPTRRGRRSGHRGVARRPGKRRPRPGHDTDRRGAAAAAAGDLGQHPRRCAAIPTREFLAGVAIAQQFARPHTPEDQAWIETLFGHVKGEWPHLEKISDPGELDRELAPVRDQYNTVRLHAGIGSLTPDDEHHGRGEGIRQARRDGLAAAREARINYRRTTTEDQP